MLSVPEQIHLLLNYYTLGIKKIYGNNLRSVILYGSYARGDYNTDSDQDIMILVDLLDEQIISTRQKISDFTYNFNMRHNLNIVPMVKSEKHFNYWKDAHPFYKNINKEGIMLYEA